MNRRAHLTDRALYKAFMELDATPDTLPVMPAYEPRLRWVLRFVQDDVDVLEIGCHKGELTTHLRAATTGRVAGLDISESALTAAAEREDEIEWVCGWADALPFPAASFDVVVACEVLEHVQEPRAVLAEAERVLRPDGWVVVSAPRYAEDMDAYEAPERDKLGLALDQHVREYVPEDELRGRRGLLCSYGHTPAAPGYEPIVQRLAAYRAG